MLTRPLDRQSSTLGDILDTLPEVANGLAAIAAERDDGRLAGFAADLVSAAEQLHAQCERLADAEGVEL